jgi:hypothetical protein
VTDILHTIKAVLKDIEPEGVEKIHMDWDRDNLWVVIYIIMDFHIA